MPTNPAVRKAIADVIASLDSPHGDPVLTITTAARDAIPGADYASIIVVGDDGSIESYGPTDPFVVNVDRLQGELHEGPCFDAANYERAFVAEDLANDGRWPTYGPKAAAMGIAAQMGMDLQHPRDARAALNLYSRRRWVFVTDLDTAEMFASHAAFVMGYVAANSRRGQDRTSYRTVSHAVGILMERYQLTTERATQLLVQTAAQSGLSLRDVADDIVNGLDRRSR